MLFIIPWLTFIPFAHTDVLLGETLGGLGLVGAFLIVVAAATNAVLDFGGVSGEDAAVGSG